LLEHLHLRVAGGEGISNERSNHLIRDRGSLEHSHFRVVIREVVKDASDEDFPVPALPVPGIYWILLLIDYQAE
jgi:hypothetical protein